MLLELADRERVLMLQLLSQELDELAPEIRHTDDRDYRVGLRDRRELVRQMIDRMQAPVPVI